MAKKAPKKKAAKAAKRVTIKGLTRTVLMLGPSGGSQCPTGYHLDGYVTIGGHTYPHCVKDN